MKFWKANQAGFEHVTLAMILLVFVTVGIVGYHVASNPSGVKNLQQTTQSVADTSSTPTPLKSKSDITSAKNGLSSESVETDLNPAQLDKDMSDLR